MEKLNYAIAWYQHKIGSYDKQLWERSVEEKVIQSFQHVPKKTAKVKAELIDVDLVRGSTFTKAKPQHGWLAVSKKGLLRVLFLPVYFDWWRRQTCLLFSLLLFTLYILQLGVLIIFHFDTGQNVNSELLSLAHLVTPVLLIVSLGILHAHIVATQQSHRQKQRKHSGKQRQQGKQRPRKKKARPKYRDKGSSNGSESMRTSHQNTLLSYCGVRHRRGNNHFQRQASDSSSGDKHEIRSHCEEEPSGEDAQQSCHLASRSETPQKKSFPSQTTNKTNDIVAAESQTGNKEDHVRGRGQGLISSPVVVEYISIEGEQTCSISQEDLGEIVETVGEIVMPNEETRSFQLSPNLVVACTSEEEPSRVNDTEGAICHSETPKLENGTEDGVSCRDDLNELFEPTGQIYIPEEKEKQQLPNLRGKQPVEISDPDVENSTNGLVSNCSKVNGVTCQISQSVTEKSASTATCSGKSQERNGKSPAGSRKFQGLEEPESTLAVPPHTLTVAFTNDTPSNGGSPCESDGEITPVSPSAPKYVIHHQGQTSEMDWEESMNTEVTVSSTSSSESSTSPELTDDNGCDNDSESTGHIHNASSVLNNLASSNDKVSCMIWEDNEVKKMDLTVMDIGWMIINKVDNLPENSDYLFLGIAFSFLGMLLPLAFRVYHGIELLGRLEVTTLTGAVDASLIVIGGNWREQAVVLNGAFQRLCLGVMFFFLLSVAERTFKQRLHYAKHFSYLTSSRRARKYELPHFRLNKVRNIKTWLSLRSYLKKRGPQRSVDTIVSAAFILAVVLVSIMCIELLQDSGGFLDHLGNWELVLWGLALGLYLLRFITLGTSINRKYRNFSVLITEQINLYLHMEQKPHKKDELMLANNVLKLAEELLKELESPFKVSGLSANPFLYNITKVIILSAFSAVLTELLGFKLKLYKIKLRA